MQSWLWNYSIALGYAIYRDINFYHIIGLNNYYTLISQFWDTPKFINTHIKFTYRMSYSITLGLRFPPKRVYAWAFTDIDWHCDNGLNYPLWWVTNSCAIFRIIPKERGVQFQELVSPWQFLSYPKTRPFIFSDHFPHLLLLECYNSLSMHSYVVAPVKWQLYPDVCTNLNWLYRTIYTVMQEL